MMKGRTMRDARRRRVPAATVAYYGPDDHTATKIVVGTIPAASEAVGPHDLKGLRAIQEERRLAQYLLVSLEEPARRVGGIQLLPWRQFLDRLWAGELIR